MTSSLHPLWTTALAMLASGSSAAAQLAPLAPFVGEHFEGFETQHVSAGGQHPASGAPQLIGGLFSGSASLEARDTPFLIQLHGSSVAACSSVHRTGSYQLGCFLGGCSIQFSSDQAAFGGYFASDNVDAQNPATREWDVRAFDALGMEIGSDTFLLLQPCGEVLWQGWALPGGTRRIEFEPRIQFKTLLMDDLMVSATAPIGQTHCVSNETSLEERGYCGATGSKVTADNSLTLHATQLPTGTFGFFLVSRDAGFLANPAGSAGTLCLSGSIGRFVGAGQIQNSGAAGTFSLDLDLTAIPGPNGPVATQAGDTWRFQAWFRDVTSLQNPQPTSNFTSGLEIQFD